MGGPKASSAMRTISMARTTPAQKPRGFSSSKVLASDTLIGLMIIPSCTLFPVDRLPDLACGNECKPLKEQYLLASREDSGVNGARVNMIEAGCAIYPYDLELGHLQNGVLTSRRPKVLLAVALALACFAAIGTIAVVTGPSLEDTHYRYKIILILVLVYSACAVSLRLEPSFGAGL